MSCYCIVFVAVWVAVLGLFSRSPAADGATIDTRTPVRAVDGIVAYDAVDPGGNRIDLLRGAFLENGLQTRHPFLIANDGIVESRRDGDWVVDLASGGELVNRGVIRFLSGIRAQRHPLRLTNEGKICAITGSQAPAVHAPRNTPLWFVNEKGASVTSLASPAIYSESPYVRISNRGTITSDQSAVLCASKRPDFGESFLSREPPRTTLSNDGVIQAIQDVWHLDLGDMPTSVELSNAGGAVSSNGSIVRVLGGNSSVLSIENTGTVRTGGQPVIWVSSGGLSHVINRSVIDAQSPEEVAILFDGKGQHTLTVDTGSRITGKIVSKAGLSSLVMTGEGRLTNAVEGFQKLILDGQSWQMLGPGKHVFGDSVCVKKGQLKFSGQITAREVTIDPGSCLVGQGESVVHAQSIKNLGTISMDSFDSLILRGPIHNEGCGSYEIATDGHQSGHIRLEESGPEALPQMLHIVIRPDSPINFDEELAVLTSDTALNSDDLARVTPVTQQLFVRPYLSLSADKRTVLVRLGPEDREAFMSHQLSDNEREMGRALSRVYRGVTYQNGGLPPQARKQLSRAITLPRNRSGHLLNMQGAVYASVPYTMSQVAVQATDIARSRLSGNGMTLMRKGVPFSAWSYAGVGQELRNADRLFSDSLTSTSVSAYAGGDVFFRKIGTVGLFAGVRADDFSAVLAKLQDVPVKQNGYLRSYVLNAYAQGARRNQYGLVDGRFSGLQAGAVLHQGQVSGEGFRGELGGRQFFIASDTGYNLLLTERWGIYPFLSLHGTYVHSNELELDSVRISGKGQVGLASVLGIGLQEALCLCGFSDDVHYPFFNFSLGWEHAWLLANYRMSASILGTDESFFIEPISASRDKLAAQVSARFLFWPALSASLIMGAHARSAHHASLGIGLEMEYHW